MYFVKGSIFILHVHAPLQSHKKQDFTPGKPRVTPESSLLNFDAGLPFASRQRDKMKSQILLEQLERHIVSESFISRK